MAKSFKLVNDGALVPAGASEYLSEVFSSEYLFGQIFLEFFSDEACTVQAAPTAGSVKVQQTHNGVNHTDLDNGSFQASAVYSESRAIITTLGKAVGIKVLLTDMVDPLYIKAEIWRT